MTHIEQFIKDAIEGGWEYHGTLGDYYSKMEYLTSEQIDADVNIALLDKYRIAAQEKARKVVLEIIKRKKKIWNKI